MKMPEGSGASSLRGRQSNQRGCQHSQTLPQPSIKWPAQPGCFLAEDKVAGTARLFLS